MLRSPASLLAAFVVLGVAAPAASAVSGDQEIIVKRTPGLSAAERAEMRESADVEFVASHRLANTEVVAAAPGERDAAIRDLNADPDVVWAEPNRRVTAQTTDQFWNLLWGLENTGQTINGAVGTADADIDVTAAWAQTKGSGVTVAVVDSGIRQSGTDLSLTTGYDWVDDDSSPWDGNGHGTHVSHTIAALENSTGIVGVAPAATIMPLRTLDDSGSGWSSDSAAAFDYAGDHGARVVNASLGSTGYTQAEYDAIAGHPNTLYIVAAGNDGTNNDTTPHYPCNYTLANVLCVGATTNTDQQASFSNYGAVSVDLHAPGEDIASMGICGGWGYCYYDGTSMATPHVTGAAALLLAKSSTLTAAQMKQLLLDGGDTLAGLSGKSVSGKRLNAGSAMALLLDAPPAPTGLAAVGGSGQIALSWTAHPDADVTSYRVYQSGTNTLLRTVNVPGTSTTLTGLPEGASRSYEITAIDDQNRESARSAPASATTADPAPAAPGGLAAIGGTQQVSLSWTANAESDLASYRVYRAGTNTLVRTVTGTSTTITGLADGTAYAYEIAAVDNGGHVSARSASASATTNPASSSTPPPSTSGPTPLTPSPSDGDDPLDDSELDAVPTLSGVSIDRAVVLCAASRRGCKVRSATLVFGLAADATVRIVAAKQVCTTTKGRGARKPSCRFKEAGRRSVSLEAGDYEATIGKTLQGIRLSTGTWRVTLSTSADTVTVPLKVTAKR